MARNLKTKELVNTRLAANYGGWMYCDSCNQNIGYLCYVTYDKFELDYTCNCGSKGRAFLDFEDSKEGTLDDKDLVLVKNRLCCPNDESPLFTVLDNKLKNYSYRVTCKGCSKEFTS